MVRRVTFENPSSESMVSVEVSSPGTRPSPYHWRKLSPKMVLVRLQTEGTRIESEVLFWISIVSSKEVLVEKQVLDAEVAFDVLDTHAPVARFAKTQLRRQPLQLVEDRGRMFG